jgi:hypothetical protein
MPTIPPDRGRKIKQARGFPAVLVALDQSHLTISQIGRITLAMIDVAFDCDRLSAIRRNWGFDEELLGQSVGSLVARESYGTTVFIGRVA